MPVPGLASRSRNQDERRHFQVDGAPRARTPVWRKRAGSAAVVHDAVAVVIDAVGAALGGREDLLHAPGYAIRAARATRRARTLNARNRAAGRGDAVVPGSV